MIEKCQLAASEISSEEVLNASTVKTVISQMESLRVTRLVVADQNAIAIYDSAAEPKVGKYILLPEVVQALDGNDVFSWEYQDGAMQSRAATPIMSYDTIVGCVYMMEYDAAQGALIQTLQKNTFYMSLILEICVTVFAIFFSNSFTKRLRKIMVSMRIIREGDYSHQVKSDCEIVYIAPTVDRVIRMLTGIASENNITLEKRIINDCSILIIEDDLYQIIFNLVENGIKYNVPGGQLLVSVDRQEDNAVISVRDTGVGIPEDSVGHVFERFYRVDKARARKTGGSGLGLSIVRNMVERNDGQIRLESKVGEGSLFTLYFPIFDTEDKE